MLLLVFSGYVIASRFLGDHGSESAENTMGLCSVPPVGISLNAHQERPRRRNRVLLLLRPLCLHNPQPKSIPNEFRNLLAKKKGLWCSGALLALKTSEQGNLFRDSRLVIPFGYDTNELPPKILTRLDELAGYMLQKTDFDIAIRGYTDSLGSNEYNRSLSTFRANVVKSYLAGKGINPNRMRVIGMGDAAPRMANNTSEGRAANRRVEIELVAHKP